MTGSGDIEGLEDLMASQGMTQLEAVLFRGLTDGYTHLEWDASDMARHLAAFLINNLAMVQE